jgi:hypothetical protein
MSESSVEPSAAEGSTYAVVLSFFRGQRWLFREEPEQARIVFEYASEAGVWSTFVVALDEAEQVVVYGVVPFAIDAARRGAVMELLTRANFGLTLGNFEIDLDDGETRFKTSLDVEGTSLLEPQLLSLVRANLAVMEHHLPAIVATSLRDARPLDALAALEAAAS